MRARLLPVLICLAVALGCAKSEHEDRASAPTREVPPAGNTQSGRMAAAPVPLLSSPQQAQDIKPFRSLPADDPNHLAAEPLLPPQIDLERLDDAAGERTALAPLLSRTPTSTADRAGGKEPFTTIRVFYGTNRAATGSRTPEEMFGTHRAETSFGFCDVSIPEAIRPANWKLPASGDSSFVKIRRSMSCCCGFSRAAATSFSARCSKKCGGRWRSSIRLTDRHSQGARCLSLFTATTIRLRTPPGGRRRSLTTSSFPALR